MEETSEWLKVKELYEKCLDDLSEDVFRPGVPSDKELITELYHYLDPHLDFLEQRYESQQKRVNHIYEKVCNEDDEAAADIYDEN